MDIIDDKSVLDMFKLHEKDFVINLYVVHMDVFRTTEDNTLENNQIGHEQENLGLQNNPIHVQDSKGDNEIYDSNSNNSWMTDLDSDLEDVIAEDRVSITSSEQSDIDMSNYEDNKDGIIVLDSESDKEVDPVRVVMSSKIWTYNPRDEIEFEKWMFFYQCGCFHDSFEGLCNSKNISIGEIKK